MIHFKTIKYSLGIKYFLYDEVHDYYYVSTNVYYIGYREYYYDYAFKKWDYKYRNTNLFEFLSEDIQIENDETLHTNDIIAVHNKKYKRLQKIDKLS